MPMPNDSKAPELKVSVAVGHALPLGKAAERWVERLTDTANGAFVTRLHRGAALADRDPTRELLALANLAGLRLRIAPQPLVQETIAALGATPRAMPFAQAQAAFAVGALDGQEGLPIAIAVGRASAFGPKHLSDWGAFADAMVFAVRKLVWDGWSPGQREAATAAAEAAIAVPPPCPGSARACRFPRLRHHAGGFNEHQGV